MKVEGSPRPKVRWLKQGVELQPCPEFQVESFEEGTSVLTIMEVFPDDQGEITCEAYNELGVASTTMVVCLQGNVSRLKLTRLHFSFLPSTCSVSYSILCWQVYKVREI